MKTRAILFALLVIALPASAEYPDSPDLEDVRNFHRVSDVLLTAGQIYPPQVLTLKEENVELVINLAVADPERNAKEPLSVAGAGITYVHIPVLWSKPTQHDLAIFFAMMDARGERKTLVHCFANYRASAFTYLYRVIREGVPETEARRDLMAIWTEDSFEENPAWRRFINASLEANGVDARV